MSIHLKFIEKLEAVNNENLSQYDHDLLLLQFYAWKEGARDAGYNNFNGDYYYFEKGEMLERPMCCGVFLDWKSKILDEVNV